MNKDRLSGIAEPEFLSSLKNPRVQVFRSLKDRKGRLAEGAFLVEGDKMVTEALSSVFPVRALLLREDRLPPEGIAGLPFAKDVPMGCTVYVLPAHVFASLSDTKTPQGVAALVALPASSFPRDTLEAQGRFPKAKPDPADENTASSVGTVRKVPGKRLLALDGVQDPGNVGTILRTADAAGLEGVLLGPDCADVFSPKVLRATMGSIFRVPLFFPENLADALSALREADYQVLSSQLDGTPFYSRPDPGSRWVLIIGNEGHGVSPAVSLQATQRLRLPMRGGAESLNAAVAAGIMMYELMKGV